MSASIPTSPPPGKDPPAHSSSTNPDSKAASDKENKSPSAAHRPTSSANIDTDSKAMPPPPIPSAKPRPVITTQHPSSNTNTNIPFSPSLTQSTSQNTAVQDQPHTSQSQEAVQEGERERERPPFTPFFTLVNDLSSGEQSTHHPSQVHYLFSDDDVSEVLTGALLRCMDQDADHDLADDEVEELDDGEDATSSSSSATFRRDGTRIRSEKSRARDRQKMRERAGKGRRKEGTTEREERVIIVDVNEAGDGVTGVSSLSPSWQVLSAEIGKAPTWDKDGAESEGGRGELAGGLMLKIEGVGLDCGEPVSSGAGLGLGVASGGSKGKGKEKERDRDAGGDVATGSASGMGEEEMQILMEGFDRKMGMLRRIVQRGSRESLVEGDREKS